MFAARESVQENLGFSLFKLAFEHLVRISLQLIKKKRLQDDPSGENLLDYVE